MRRLESAFCSRSLTRAALALAVSIAFGPRSPAAQGAPANAPLDLRTLDACALVPIEAVASALGAKPVGTKQFRADDGTLARCNYTLNVASGGADSRDVYVIWVLAPDDYAGLRDVAEPPVTDLKGVGDAAHVTFDKDSGRYWLAVLVRGRATLQVTGEKLDAVRKVADVAIARVRAAGTTAKSR